MAGERASFTKRLRFLASPASRSPGPVVGGTTTSSPPLQPETLVELAQRRLVDHLCIHDTTVDSRFPRRRRQIKHSVDIRSRMGGRLWGHREAGRLGSADTKSISIDIREWLLDCPGDSAGSGFRASREGDDSLGLVSSSAANPCSPRSIARLPTRFRQRPRRRMIVKRAAGESDYRIAGDDRMA